MITKRATDLRRLNVLLRLSGVNVATLNAGEWAALLDDLYFAEFGTKGRVFKQDDFHFSMTRRGVGAAQRELRTKLPILLRLKGTDPAPFFDLQQHQLYMAWGPDGFATKFRCDDGPTVIYLTLVHLLERARVRQHEMLTCANPHCQAVFVPLRKPHAGQPSFCFKKCENRIAASRYRKKHKPKLRQREQARSQQRYAVKVHKQTPGAKIGKGRKPSAQKGVRHVKK